MKNNELLFDVLGEIDPALTEDAAPEKKGAVVGASDGRTGGRKQFHHLSQHSTAHGNSKRFFFKLAL